MLLCRFVFATTISQAVQRARETDIKIDTDSWCGPQELKELERKLWWLGKRENSILSEEP